MALSFADALKATGGDDAAATAMVFAEAPQKRTSSQSGKDLYSSSDDDDDELNERFEELGQQGQVGTLSKRMEKLALEPANKKARPLYEDDAGAIPLSAGVSPNPNVTYNSVLRLISDAGKVDAAEGIMMLLAPWDLRDVCTLNRFYADICTSPGFRSAYTRKHFIRVRVLGLDGSAYNFVFYKYRGLRDVYARIPKRIRITFHNKFAHPLSSLSAMVASHAAERPDEQVPAGADLVLFYTLRVGPVPEKAEMWILNGSHNPADLRPTDFP